MANIRVIPDAEWTDGLAELYPAVVDPTYKRVDNILAVHSLNPQGMAAHQALYTSAMRGTASLRKVERELIALVVSQENECHY
jgi:alkylhydroperoxidase family enzyme